MTDANGVLSAVYDPENRALRINGGGGSSNLSGLNDVDLTSPQDGDVLTYDSGSGKWENEPSAGGPPSGTAGGDLSGTYPNPTVAKINGVAYNADPLAQYALLAGRSGGQTLIGGTGGTDTLTLKGDAASTRALTLRSTGVLRIGTPFIPNAGTAAILDGSISVENGFGGLCYLATMGGDQCASLDLRSFGGTWGASTATPSGTAMGAWHIGGNTGDFSGTPGLKDVATIICRSTQDYEITQTDLGAKWEFYTNPDSSGQSQTLAFTIDQDGSVIGAKDLTIAGEVSGATNMVYTDGTVSAVSSTFGFIPLRYNAVDGGLSGGPIIQFQGSHTTGLPTPVLAAMETDDGLGTLQFGGLYDSTPTHISHSARIGAAASETWTSTARGTYLTFGTVAIGTTAPLTTRLILDDVGKLWGGATTGGALWSIDQTGAASFEGVVADALTTESITSTGGALVVLGDVIVTGTAAIGAIEFESVIFANTFDDDTSVHYGISDENIYEATAAGLALGTSSTVDSNAVAQAIGAGTIVSGTFYNYRARYAVNGAATVTKRVALYVEAATLGSFSGAPYTRNTAVTAGNTFAGFKLVRVMSNNFFNANDVGAAVTGPGVPASTVISSVSNLGLGYSDAIWTTTAATSMQVNQAYSFTQSGVTTGYTATSTGPGVLTTEYGVEIPTGFTQGIRNLSATYLGGMTVSTAGAVAGVTTLQTTGSISINNATTSAQFGGVRDTGTTIVVNTTIGQLIFSGAVDASHNLAFAADIIAAGEGTFASGTNAPTHLRFRTSSTSAALTSRLVMDSAGSHHFTPTVTTGLVTAATLAIKSDGSIYGGTVTYSSNQPTAGTWQITAAGAATAVSLVLSGAITGATTIAASTSLTTPIVYGSSSSAGTLNLQATSNATGGVLSLQGGGLGTQGASFKISALADGQALTSSAASNLIQGMVCAPTVTYSAAPGIATYGWHTFVDNPTLQDDGTASNHLQQLCSSFDATPTLKSAANSGAQTVTAHAGFRYGPTLVSGGSTGTLSVSMRGFHFNPATIPANSTVTNMLGLLISQPGNNGTVTNFIGVDIPAMTIGGTLNLGIRTLSDILVSAANIQTDTSTGMQIATSTSQKLGFFGHATTAQPSAYTQTYSTATKTHTQGTMTDPATYGAGSNGYSTAGQAQAIHAEVIALKANMVTVQGVVNAIIDDLQSLGLLA